MVTGLKAGDYIAVGINQWFLNPDQSSFFGPNCAPSRASSAAFLDDPQR